MFAKAARYAPALRQQRIEKIIPIVGPSSKAFLPQIHPERSINLFTVKPERENEPWSLRGTPGLSLFATLPKTPIRGRIVHDGRYFAVAGARVYEVRPSGTVYEWGAISTVRGKVTMASIGAVIVIGDGSRYYALDLEAETVTETTDAPRGRFCVFYNQRILYQGEGGQVFYSELEDPTNIPGLNVFTAESLPDDLVAMATTEGQIWLISEDGTEVWYDSGDADNPFQRVPGGVIYTGTQWPDTVLRLDNSIWFVGNDKDGSGIVWRTNGLSLVRVSTSTVERFTSSATELSAYSYQEEGHTFFVLNSSGQTFAYDLKTGEWHERAWLNRETGTQERQRQETSAYCYGTHLVTDYESGKVYKQSLAYYSDAGQEIRRTRISPRLNLTGSNTIIDELYIKFATGVGLDGSGQGTDPEVMLRTAPDGMQFGTELTAPLGGIGAYDTQVRFFGLGVGRDWTFEISWSDPVLTGLTGAAAVMRPGKR